MANIRIKDLANTASSTASDDFIGIDGATNGTRKLNAYSPSFGGNATVAGTLGVGPSSTLGTVNITTPNLIYGTVYLNGATTGADFMRLKSSGADGVFGIESSVGSSILGGSSANATVLHSVGSNPLQFGTAGTVKGTLTSGGNLLIGTTTDSANGKLQLADHTTSAGGIGFGTDISLYRVNPNSFKIGLSAANFTLDAGGSGTGGARIVGGGGLTLTSNTGESLYLQSGGLVGITINSSQQVQVNATTASTTTSTGALVVGNGSSGGLGVGGAANIGGTLTVNGGSGIVTQGGGSDTTLQVTQTGTAGAYCLLKSTAAPSAAFGGYSFEDAGSVRWFIGGQGGYANSAHDFNVTVNGAYRFRIDTAGVSRVLSTTASTSTSTGALVVSGGVGVAGAINAGGVTATKANGTVMGAYSGASGSFADIAIGRTASEHFIGVAGASNNYVTGTVAGDWALNAGSATASIFIGINGTAISKVDSNDFTIASGKGLKVGNAYVAGAPTATGYIVIKDSTGTSYKIPAVAL